LGKFGELVGELDPDRVSLSRTVEQIEPLRRYFPLIFKNSP